MNEYVHFALNFGPIQSSFGPTSMSNQSLDLTTESLFLQVKQLHCSFVQLKVKEQLQQKQSMEVEILVEIVESRKEDQRRMEKN